MNVKHYIEDKLLVIEFTEEIDHHMVEKIKQRTDYEIQRLMPKKVIFDFEKVNFMDSAGIGLVIGRYKNISCYGGSLELRNTSTKLKRIFELSGLKELIKEEKLA